MEIKEFIKKFEDVFEDTDVSTLEPETKLRELDEWSSMIALSTMAMVCEEYDVELTPEEIRSVNTFEELFNIVKSQM